MDFTRVVCMDMTAQFTESQQVQAMPPSHGSKKLIISAAYLIIFLLSFHDGVGTRYIF